MSLCDVCCRMRYLGGYYDGNTDDNGVPNGWGLLKTKHQAYHGQWVHGVKSGEGITYKNGVKVYSGQWKNNLPHGIGVEYYPSGKPASWGTWVRGRLEGDDCESFDDAGNLVFKGQWRRGVPDGVGSWYINGVVEYVGDFRNGLRHGHGVIYNDGREMCNATWYKGVVISVSI